MDWISHGDGSKVRRQHGLNDGPVVLYSGVLDEFQRIDLLIEAMAHLSLYEKNAKLLLVVTIPQAHHEARIRKQAATLGIADRVILTEPQSLDSVRDFLKAGDVAVVPRPQAPGFPIKLLNYMASGIPCTMFSSSSSSGIRDRHNALLVAPDSSEALGEGILELLRDGPLRKRLSQNAKTFVRDNHGREEMARRVYSAYVRTLEAAGRVEFRTRPPAISKAGIASPLPSIIHQNGTFHLPGAGLIQKITKHGPGTFIVSTGEAIVLAP